MRTKKEILKDKGITSETQYHVYSYLWEAILEAMDEYALQQQEEAAKARYEKAIKSILPITLSPWDFKKIDDGFQIASGYKPKNL